MRLVYGTVRVALASLRVRRARALRRGGRVFFPVFSRKCAPHFVRQLDGNTGEHNRKTEVGVVQRVDLHQIEPVVRRQHATQAVTQLACLFTLWPYPKKQASFLRSVSTGRTKAP